MCGAALKPPPAHLRSPRTRWQRKGRTTKSLCVHMEPAHRLKLQGVAARGCYFLLAPSPSITSHKQIETTKLPWERRIFHDLMKRFETFTGANAIGTVWLLCWMDKQQALDMRKFQFRAEYHTPSLPHRNFTGANVIGTVFLLCWMDKKQAWLAKFSFQGIYDPSLSFFPLNLSLDTKFRTSKPIIARVWWTSFR